MGAGEVLGRIVLRTPDNELPEMTGCQSAARRTGAPGQPGSVGAGHRTLLPVAFAVLAMASSTQRAHRMTVALAIP